MRRIRVRVEAYLARHDFAGADAYMPEQRQELAKEGDFVRRLNMAYLAFFGSYAGTANPVEPKLRRIRQRSDSLASFLEKVSQIQTPADLDRLAEERRGLRQPVNAAAMDGTDVRGHPRDRIDEVEPHFPGDGDPATIWRPGRHGVVLGQVR